MDLSNYTLEILNLSCTSGNKEVISSVIYEDTKDCVYKFNSHLYLSVDIFNLFRPNDLHTYYLPFSIVAIYNREKQMDELIRIFGVLKSMNVDKDLLNIYEQLLNNIIFDV